jgi:hypothetical protein
LEEAGCVGMSLVGIVIILILQANNIVLMVRSPYDLDKKLIILKEFFSSMGVTIDTKKIKVMVIKSKMITYTNFMYEINSLEEVNSYKYLNVNIHHNFN